MAQQNQNKVATEPTIREQIGGTLDAINLAFIAREYFAHDPTWLTHKINGAIVGSGKRYPQKFTQEERTQFKYALKDLARRIYESADRI